MSLKLLLPLIAWGGVGVEGLEWYSYRKKKTRLIVGNFKNNPMRGAKILACGRGLKYFFTRKF